jgi:hypothetical protein
MQVRGANGEHSNLYSLVEQTQAFYKCVGESNSNRKLLAFSILYGFQLATHLIAHQFFDAD